MVEEHFAYSQRSRADAIGPFDLLAGIVSGYCHCSPPIRPTKRLALLSCYLWNCYSYGGGDDGAVFHGDWDSCDGTKKFLPLHLVCPKKVAN